MGRKISHGSHASNRSSGKTLSKPDRSRLGTAERAIVIAEVLRNQRFGSTIKEVHEQVLGVLGDGLCERTVRRYILLLEKMGRAESEEPRGRYEGHRFRYVGAPLIPSCGNASLPDAAVLMETNLLLRDRLRVANALIESLRAGGAGR